MPYIDYTFYTTEFKGVPLDEGTFLSFVDRASDLIDIVTNHKIEAIGFTNLHEKIQLRVKKAVAAQVEHMFKQENSGDLNVTIGKFKYSQSNNNEQQTNDELSTIARRYLAQTGLMYRGL